MKSFRESVFGSRAWAFVKEQNVPHMFPFMLYLIGYMLVFRYLETAPRMGYVDVSSNLDSLIPFCEIFIVPYISWFLFQAIWVVLVFIIDRKTYDQLTTMLMVGMTVFLVVSILVPTRLSLRPYFIPRNNIFVKWCLLLWKVDTPTNVWPSIHVYNSAVIAIAFFKSKKEKLRTLPVRLLIGIWSAGIIASTAFVKQHSLFDIISALALTVIVYIVVYTYGKVYHCEKWDAMWETKKKGA